MRDNDSSTRPRIIVFVMLFVVQTIFSVWPIFVQNALSRGFSSLLLSIWRDLFASTALVLAAGFEINSWREVIDQLYECFSSPTEMRLFLFLGLASCVNSVGFVMSLNFVTPFNASILHPSIPVFAGAFAIISGVEKFCIRKALGSTMCIFGSLIVIGTQSNIALGKSLLGNFLVILHSLAMAALLVGQKFLSKRHSVAFIAAVYYSVGTIMSLPICVPLLIIEGDFKGLTTQAGFVIFFGAIFVVAFNQAALTWANKASSPVVPASSMMLQPPITYFVVYLLGAKEELGFWELFGGVCIISGLIFTIFNVHPSPSIPPSEKAGTHDIAATELTALTSPSTSPVPTSAAYESDLDADRCAAQTSQPNFVSLLLRAALGALSITAPTSLCETAPSTKASVAQRRAGSRDEAEGGCDDDALVALCPSTGEFEIDDNTLRAASHDNDSLGSNYSPIERGSNYSSVDTAE